MDPYARFSGVFQSDLQTPASRFLSMPDLGNSTSPPLTTLKETANRTFGVAHFMQWVGSSKHALRDEAINAQIDLLVLSQLDVANLRLRRLLQSEVLRGHKLPSADTETRLSVSTACLRLDVNATVASLISVIVGGG